LRSVRSSGKPRQKEIENRFLDYAINEKYRDKSKKK